MELLEVLRVQRHDFLNHLQVISGLIQLKRFDGVQDYIRQVAEELARQGALSRMGTPELVVVLLTADLNAARHGLKINKAIQPGIEPVRIGPSSVAVIRDLLALAIESPETDPSCAGEICLNIGLEGGKYLFQVAFPCRECEGNSTMAAGMDSLKKQAAELGGDFKAETDGGTVVLTLAVPEEK